MASHFEVAVNVDHLVEDPFFTWLLPLVHMNRYKVDMKFGNKIFI